MDSLVLLLIVTMKRNVFGQVLVSCVTAGGTYGYHCAVNITAGGRYGYHCAVNVPQVVCMVTTVQ